MTFQAEWTRAYEASLPLGYVLRAAHPDLWTRFHGLPQAQRLSASEAQTETVLARAEALGSSCFADGAGLWLVVCHYPGRSSARVLTSRFTMYDEGMEATLDIQADPVVWRATEHREVFRDIAEDRDRALFFDPATGQVLAPYDGGFDLFDPDPARRSARARRFGDWLSQRADGL